MRSRCWMLALLMLSACGPRAYRIHYNNGVPTVDAPLLEHLKTEEFDRTLAAPGREWAYRMAFVEFDDRGELYEREQLNKALQMIEQIKDAGRKRNKQAVVAVFVHGWKNNASDKSGNVWGFRQTLAGLAVQYDSPLTPGSSAEPVVGGIYIGWRGAVLNVPILKDSRSGTGETSRKTCLTRIWWTHC